MIFLWREAPLLKVLIPFMAGIAIYFIVPVNSSLIEGLMAIGLIVLLCLSFYVKDYWRLKFGFIINALLQALLILIGHLSCISHDISNQVSWYSPYQSSSPYSIVRVKDEPLAKPKTFKVLVEVNQLVSNNHSKITSGEAILYLQKNDVSANLWPGDILLIKNKFQDIKQNNNPGGFDYQNYCRNKNIYQSAYLQTNEWKKLTRRESTFSDYFLRLSYATRQTLKQYIHDSSHLGFAEALLIGFRGDLDQDLMQAYTNTGLAHIIAISGMHMAMVYATVRYLLFLIPWMKKRKSISLGFAIISMWLFAAITGLPPSVTRAAIMFSFIGIAELIDQDISPLNNIAASAFFLLCINPFWLLDVGFQLSYLAVLSLIIFYSPIYQLIYIRWKAVDAVWKLIAGTLAAQILTLPLCILYFHQFPLLFLVSNLIAVPATTIILYVEILLVFLSPFKLLAKQLGHFISIAIQSLNKIVFFLSEQSYAVWRELQISTLEMAFLYALIICISIWLIRKNPQFIIWSLAGVLALLSGSCINSYHQLKQHKIVVYDWPKQRALEFISGKKFFTPDEDVLIVDKKNMKFISSPAHRFFGCNRRDTSIQHSIKFAGADLFLFRQKSILRLNKKPISIKKKIHIDYLILSSGAEKWILPVLDSIKTTQIIIDSSMPTWKLAQLKKDLAKARHPVHCCYEQGAYINEIQP